MKEIKDKNFAVVDFFLSVKHTKLRKIDAFSVIEMKNVHSLVDILSWIFLNCRGF